MPRLSKIGAAALAAFGWTGLSSVSASYLVVAGGGGGGTSSSAGGGGGAGGLLSGTASLNPTLSYTVTVGAGGASAPSAASEADGTSGANSSISTLSITSIGGGGGSAGGVTGLSGGSGGGGGGGSVTTGGSATSGQGNAGGGGIVGSSDNRPAGGGGGAGATGGNASTNLGGNGGNGSASSISGTSVTYAGGGGGGVGGSGSAGGSGGTGGGGAGAKNANATSGTAKLGGGGGGTSYAPSGSPSGGSGGSGVVIISYPAPQQFGGGVVTTSGSNVIHTFNTSGTLSPLSSLTASYLIVAGGASGASRIGGGGGAGGLLTGSGLTIDTNSNYVVVVGAGGASVSSTPGTNGNNGNNSSFSGFATAAVGGGGGGAYITSTSQNGIAGGSGGGASSYNNSTTGGSGTSGQGNAGGGGVTLILAGSGGGGAGAVGGNASAVNNGGAGGVGVSSSISGTATYYAGGGGGSATATPGAGGTGGGGAGATNQDNATAGTANTGGGGGGARNGTDTTNVFSGAGGSGVVIISYAGSTQQMAGGTVTITGGNVIHTFTSSGYLTPIKYVNNSLRFRNSASANLTRTPSVASNRTTFTISTWVKRGLLGTGYYTMFGAGSSGSAYSGIWFNADTLVAFSYPGSTAYNLTTTQVFRDPAAWYHLVFAFDTTQATSSNRIKIYVNGVQVTSFSSSTYPSQNYADYYDSVTTHYIGYSQGGVNYFDGYMAEINFIDGQALTPNSFGTFNSYGVWQPITYGGSYGTNGFYLPFKTNGSTYVGSFSTSWLTLASNTAFNVFGGDMTVECWFNATSLTNSPHLFAFVQDATNRESIYFNSSALTFYSSSSAGSGNRIATGTISTGVWYHYALVKSGSTFTMYLNGVSVGTSTTTQYSTANQSLQIGTYNSGSYGGDNFSGYISNVRVVKGTAVYTSNFIPPTANLSAVTNTQLLTLQNTTIIDNSTNAFSITNTNTVTTGQTYPFSASLIFNDQGPQGNNWTPNNISGAFGTTLDYMTDVPTLTSATAANYATLNPLAVGSSGTLSDGSLKIAGVNSANVGASYSTIGMITGKWYFEITAVGVGSNFTYALVEDVLDTSALNVSGSIFAGYRSTGDTYGTVSITTTTWNSAGVVIGVAVDCDNGAIYFANANTWINSGVPTSGASRTGAITTYTAGTKTLFGGVGCYQNSSQSAAINFGQRSFTYTPPSGFVALNTYNL